MKTSFMFMTVLAIVTMLLAGCGLSGVPSPDPGQTAPGPTPTPDPTVPEPTLAPDPETYFDNRNEYLVDELACSDRWIALGIARRARQEVWPEHRASLAWLLLSAGCEEVRCSCEDDFHGVWSGLREDLAEHEFDDNSW